MFRIIPPPLLVSVPVIAFVYYRGDLQLLGKTEIRVQSVKRTMLTLNNQISRNVFHLCSSIRCCGPKHRISVQQITSVRENKKKTKTVTNHNGDQRVRSNDGTVGNRLVVSVSNEAGRGHSRIGPKPRWYVKQKRLHTTMRVCTYVYIFFLQTYVELGIVCVCLGRIDIDVRR